MIFYRQKNFAFKLKNFAARSGFFIGAIEMSAEKNLWERRENKSSKAFQAFCVYRDLGAGRTLAAVAEKLRKSYDLIRRWSKNHYWQSRADAWDEMISEKAAQKAAEEYAKMLEVQINLGKMLQAKAAKAIQNMDFENVSIKSLPSVVNAINVGVEIERTARELTLNDRKSIEDFEDVTIIQLPPKNKKI